MTLSLVLNLIWVIIVVSFCGFQIYGIWKFSKGRISTIVYTKNQVLFNLSLVLLNLYKCFTCSFMSYSFLYYAFWVTFNAGFGLYYTKKYIKLKNQL